jgi:hypothetical protein
LPSATACFNWNIRSRDNPRINFYLLPPANALESVFLEKATPPI